MRSVEIKVVGQVQGVFYRASTQAKARALDLVGWVKNEPDGSVLIYANGEDDAVAALIAWTRVGPENAVVSNITVHEVGEESFSQFKVLY